jgi:sec-independent protein translocase protein TatC
MVVPLVFSSTILFYIGAAFAYFAVFPVVFGFLAGVGPAEVNFAPDINEYLSFTITMFFAFGFVFEVPVATVLLILIGVVTPEQLAEKRRYAILVAFILGAIFTPPDILSQFMMAIPVWFLYELGIVIGRILLKRQGGPVLPGDDEPEPDGSGPGGGSGGAPSGGSSGGSEPAAPRQHETEKDEDFDFDRAFEEIEREQESLDQTAPRDDKARERPATNESSETTAGDNRPGKPAEDDESDQERPGRK